MNVQDLDVEMGFPVTGRLPGKGDIQPGEIQQGRVATCVHMGPNSELGPAYDALSKWIKDNGYEAADLVYEVYLNDPAETPAQELRTQIVFPLKKG
jgi:effector-binding domain-containing protein